MKAYIVAQRFLDPAAAGKVGLVENTIILADSMQDAVSKLSVQSREMLGIDIEYNPNRKYSATAQRSDWITFGGRRIIGKWELQLVEANIFGGGRNYFIVASIPVYTIVETYYRFGRDEIVIVADTVGQATAMLLRLKPEFDEPNGRELRLKSPENYGVVALYGATTSDGREITTGLIKAWHVIR